MIETQHETIQLRIYPTYEQINTLDHAFEVTREAFNYIVGELRRYKTLGKYKESSDILTNINIFGNDVIKNSEQFPREIVTRILKDRRIPKNNNDARLFSQSLNEKKYCPYSGSFTLSNNQFSLIKENSRTYLDINTIGKFRIFQIDRLKGTPLNIMVYRSAQKYYVNMTVLTNKKVEQPTSYLPVAIAFNQKSFLTLSNSLEIFTPFKLTIQIDKAKAMIKQLKAREDKQSKSYLKLRLRYLKQKDQLNAIVSDFLHKLSSVLVANYTYIAVDVSQYKPTQTGPIQGLRAKLSLYNKLIKLLEYKCKMAGKTLIKYDSRELYKMGALAMTSPLNKAITMEQYMSKSLNRTDELPYKNKTLIEDLNKNKFNYSVSDEVYGEPKLTQLSLSRI